MISNAYILLRHTNVPKAVNSSNYTFNVHGMDREGFLSWLKDESNWSNFVNSDYSEKAQRASTIEQYVPSYNKVHTKKIYISGDYSNEYNIGNNEKTTTTNISIEKNMDIYYNQSREKELGYFLIAPSSLKIDTVLFPLDISIPTPYFIFSSFLLIGSNFLTYSHYGSLHENYFSLNLLKRI